MGHPLLMVSQINLFMRCFRWPSSARFIAVRSACGKGLTFLASERADSLWRFSCGPRWALDGLPFSLFKPNLSWWQDASLHFLQPRFLMACCSQGVETEHRCRHFQAKRPCCSSETIVHIYCFLFLESA